MNKYTIVICHAEKGGPGPKGITVEHLTVVTEAENVSTAILQALAAGTKTNGETWGLACVFRGEINEIQ